MALALSIFSYAQTTNLIISEYGEGNGGSKKYIEIFNGTGAAVDLSNYQIWRSTNGAAWTSGFGLTGTLANNDTYVIGNNVTDVPGADLYNTQISFNGDDGIAIAWNGGTGTTFTLLDVFGEALDPGTGWEIAGIANASVDKIVTRKSSVCSPTTNWTLSRGTDAINSQWEVSAFLYNDVAQPAATLGLHTANCVAGCSSTNTITATACGSYTLNSQTYTSTGQYTQTLTNANAQGCDSIITLNLTINPTFAVTLNQSICQGSSYVFGTQTLTATGTYTQTLPSVQNGCDSVVTLNLTVLAQFNTTSSAAICQGESYTFGTQTLTTAGTFNETFQSIQGCDSVVTLTLAVNAPTTSTLTVTSCGDYTLNTQTYTTGGTYTQVIENAAGCDSTITLELTINQPSNSSLTETACGSFTLNGQTYTATGVYTQTLVNAANCDSTVTLNLTINPQPGNVTVSGDQTICEGESFEPFTATQATGEALIISGVVDAQLPGGLPKAIVLYAIDDIADLSVYGLGSVVNGGGSVGVEFAFPQQVVTAGSFIYVSTDSLNFNNFFGFYPTFKSDVANINGDDAVELFKNGTVIDVFGEISVDGTGTPWEYMDGWAHRNNGSLPNGSTFNLAQWTFSGINVYDNQTTNATTPTPFPVGQFSTQNAIGTIAWYSDANLTTQVATGNTFTTPITTGTATYYVVSAINTCVSATATVTATVASTPVASATLANIAELTATPAGMSYQWIDCATETPIAGATAATFTAPANGSYAVIVTNTAGCADTSDCVNVTQLSVTDLDELVSVSLYPNPTTGVVNVAMNPEWTVNAIVMDAQGKVVIDATSLKNASEISLASMENGVYFIQLNTSLGSKMFRVVKQ